MADADLRGRASPRDKQACRTWNSIPSPIGRQDRDAETRSDAQGLRHALPSAGSEKPWDPSDSGRSPRAQRNIWWPGVAQVLRCPGYRQPVTPAESEDARKGRGGQEGRGTGWGVRADVGGSPFQTETWSVTGQSVAGWFPTDQKLSLLMFGAGRIEPMFVAPPYFVPSAEGGPTQPWLCAGARVSRRWPCPSRGTPPRRPALSPQTRASSRPCLSGQGHRGNTAGRGDHVL